MNRSLFTGFLLCLTAGLWAQVSYTANDQVTPYEGYFGYGTNVGWYPNWRAEELGDIAIGNPDEGVRGVGITSMRPALYEHFQEQWGYDFRVPTFEHYKKLGAVDNVVFVGYPSVEHRDSTFYCGSHQSEMFKNMYLPIWDDGSDGTPINEENYYAVYLYKTVQLYKDYVKFWEIWNEPDFSFTANSIRRPGEPGNWWEHNPEPCDYSIRAPIFHYIRMLRISYDVIKTVDPDAYVAIGGIGYPSFLDAVLRNTDNPNDGQATAEFPLKGGAYFDVLSYHTYPHIDGSLRTWSNDIRGFVYKRHTDAAVDGVIRLRDEFDHVLTKHGYDSDLYPEKEWIITESNVPRKKLNKDWGSDEVQRNFIIKSLVESQKHNIHQFHIFTLGDKFEYEEAQNIYDEYHLMGLFKNMFKANPYEQIPNDIGICYATTSDLLYKKRFDHETFDKIDWPLGIRAGVFKDEDGKKTYVLWSATKSDNSESSAQVVNLRKLLGSNKFVKKEWDFADTQDSTVISGNDVRLTGEPIFLTAAFSDEGPRPRDHSYDLNVYPNPFLVSLEIEFTVADEDIISLKMVDQFGRVAKTLLDDELMEAGTYYWDLDGADFRPGVYFIHFRNSNKRRLQKVMVFRTNGE